MNPLSGSTPRPPANPRRLTSLLEEAGWRRGGGREGLYVRYSPPSGDEEGTLPVRMSVVVPLDPRAPDFQVLWQEALAVLSGFPESALVERVLSAPTDQYCFEKETTAPKGWIRWDEGMEIHAAARLFLATTAKTAREHLKYFGNRHGQFANRFLDEVMMGQTAVASYVVRAYIPTDVAIPLKHSQAESSSLSLGVDVITGREVSRTAVLTLESAREAIEHYRAHNSLAAFFEARSPLSYEAVVAIKELAADASGSEISVSWEPTDLEQPERRWAFVFEPSDVPVLEKAASTLIATEPKRRVTALGIVHLLTRAEAEGPGVVGITTIGDAPAKKLRVRLDPGDYHRAVSAHDNGAIVKVFGDLEREGNLAWLYDATIETVREGDVDESGRLF